MKMRKRVRRAIAATKSGAMALGLTMTAAACQPSLLDEPATGVASAQEALSKCSGYNVDTKTHGGWTFAGDPFAANVVALLPNGNRVAAIPFTQVDGSINSFLHQTDAHGQLVSMNHLGFAAIDERANSIVALDDGSGDVIVAGSVGSGATEDVLIARVNPTSGAVAWSVTVGSPQARELATGVFRTPEGRNLVLGAAADPAGGQSLYLIEISDAGVVNFARKIEDQAAPAKVIDQGAQILFDRDIRMIAGIRRDFSATPAIESLALYRVQPDGTVVSVDTYPLADSAQRAERMPQVIATAEGYAVAYTIAGGAEKRAALLRLDGGRDPIDQVGYLAATGVSGEEATEGLSIRLAPADGFEIGTSVNYVAGVLTVAGDGSVVSHFEYGDQAFSPGHVAPATDFGAELILRNYEGSFLMVTSVDDPAAGCCAVALETEAEAIAVERRAEDYRAIDHGYVESGDLRSTPSVASQLACEG